MTRLHPLRRSNGALALHALQASPPQHHLFALS